MFGSDGEFGSFIYLFIPFISVGLNAYWMYLLQEKSFFSFEKCGPRRSASSDMCRIYKYIGVCDWVCNSSAIPLAHTIFAEAKAWPFRETRIWCKRSCLMLLRVILFVISVVYGLCISWMYALRLSSPTGAQTHASHTNINVCKPTKHTYIIMNNSILCCVCVCYCSE